MMKKIIYLLILFSIVSCENEKVKYYPSDFDISEFNGEIISLDSTNYNFSQITDKIDFQNLILEFNDNKTTKQVIPYNFKFGSFRKKNILGIDSDSIYKENGFSIDKIDLIMEKHYLNKGKNNEYPDFSKKAVVAIMIDSTDSGKKLKKLLVKVTNSFDKLEIKSNDTLKLYVFLNYLKIDKKSIKD
ncbi:hypothetical protein MHL31_04285 [Lutibacter sp. A80]|uniref:hypothetical protein n=1 Tax=Lutibacter sp. A80 TaxID=2918453 RepID=UPI001F05089E|nr:hypothetical protein [Lutibacter sp. A80]UMB61427.1 hypothetical protein MHL31_04285 [Lutibacter sp. A80]